MAKSAPIEYGWQVSFSVLFMNIHLSNLSLFFSLMNVLMREEWAEKIAVTKMATEGDHTCKYLFPQVYFFGRPEITTTGTRFCDNFVRFCVVGGAHSHGFKNLVSALVIELLSISSVKKKWLTCAVVHGVGVSVFNSPHSTCISTVH